MLLFSVFTNILTQTVIYTVEVMGSVGTLLDSRLHHLLGL